MKKQLSKEHIGTPQNAIDRTENGQTKRLSGHTKEHVNYWKKKLRKRSYVGRSGQKEQIAEWQVRLFHAGREGWFNLDTANRDAAAEKARERHQHLVANGWEATLAKFKPKSESDQIGGLTVGGYLRAVEESGFLNPRTFLNYQNCLRTIVAGAFGVQAQDSRFDYRSGGNKQWVERIDRTKISRITPVKIEKWKSKFLKKAGHSPVKQASAKRTANSYIRCARSLFSQKLMDAHPGLKWKLPSPPPFAGVRIFEGLSSKYKSKINSQVLIAAAKNELKASDPEAYKVFFLGLFAGLRKGEIDGVTWDMIDWKNSLIRLEQTEFMHLKTQGSEAEISLDPEVTAELKAFLAQSKSKFVITSDRPPRNDSKRTYYRCEKVFDTLNQWLRKKGISANKPLHELRKEVGATIATEQGIYAASRFLRHTDITTTARHYADQKKPVVAGLGKFLQTEIIPVKPEGHHANG